MNSSKSALLAAIVGTAVLVVAFGLILAFVPAHKKLAFVNTDIVAALDWINLKKPRSRQPWDL